MRLGLPIVPGNKEVLKQNKKKYIYIMKNSSHLKEPTVAKAGTTVIAHIDTSGL